MEYEKFKEQFVEDLKERLALDDDLIRNPKVVKYVLKSSLLI